MNFQFYVEKLKSSKTFKDFIKENKKAFPCSCFFIIDKEEGKDKQHFDFYVAGKNEIFTFELESDAKKVPADMGGRKSLTPISLNHDFDFNQIEEAIREKIEQEKISNKIQKMLFSMQSKDGKDFFIGTIFITAFGLINMTLDLEEMKIKKFEKRSFFDLMNIFKQDK